MSSDVLLKEIQLVLPQLRSTIENTLGDEIGVYEFPNDSGKDKAIAVLGLGADRGGEYPPRETKVTGLEVTIYTAQGVRIERRLDGIIQTLVTVITLKQFDQQKNTLKPLLRLLDVLDIARDPIRTLRDPYLGNIEVCQIETSHSFYSDFSIT
jgi:hypothetical protein